MRAQDNFEFYLCCNYFWHGADYITRYVLSFVEFDTKKRDNYFFKTLLESARGISRTTTMQYRASTLAAKRKRERERVTM